MMKIEAVLERFGGLRSLAKALGVAPSTVQGWVQRGRIPASREGAIVRAAGEAGLSTEGLAERAPQESAPQESSSQESAPQESGSAPESAPAPRPQGWGRWWLGLLLMMGCVLMAVVVLRPYIPVDPWLAKVLGPPPVAVSPETVSLESLGGVSAERWQQIQQGWESRWQQLERRVAVLEQALTQAQRGALEHRHPEPQQLTADVRALEARLERLAKMAQAWRQAGRVQTEPALRGQIEALHQRTVLLGLAQSLLHDGDTAPWLAALRAGSHQGDVVRRLEKLGRLPRSRDLVASFKALSVSASPAQNTPPARPRFLADPWGWTTQMLGTWIKVSRVTDSEALVVGHILGGDVRVAGALIEKSQPASAERHQLLQDLARKAQALEIGHEILGLMIARVKR